MSTATCIKDYDGVGFLKENKDGCEEVHIKKGDIIEWIIKDIFGMITYVSGIWMLILVNILNFKSQVNLTFFLFLKLR